MQIFSPEHEGPAYEVNLPFYDSKNREKYWIGFCLKGGRGINEQGVSVSDPGALYLEKPQVGKDCRQMGNNVTTLGISQPTNLEIKTLNSDTVLFDWDEPTKTGGSPILRYRLRISEKDNLGSPYTFDTTDDKTEVKFKTPRAMQGKDWTVTVQAVNKDQKLSLISEHAIFSVPKAGATVKASKKEPKKAAPKPKPAAITYVDSKAATAGHIPLVWQDVSDAKDYKIYWDKGDQEDGSQYQLLVSSTSGQNQFTVDAKNSGGVLGAKELYTNGGKFNFKVTYISSTDGRESAESKPFAVTIKPTQKKDTKKADDKKDQGKSGKKI